jgi:hypothetical protein
MMYRSGKRGHPGMNGRIIRYLKRVERGGGVNNNPNDDRR